MTGPRSCRICGPAAPRPRAAISTFPPHPGRVRSSWKTAPGLLSSTGPLACPGHRRLSRHSDPRAWMGTGRGRRPSFDEAPGRRIGRERRGGRLSSRRVSRCVGLRRPGKTGPDPGGVPAGEGGGFLPGPERLIPPATPALARLPQTSVHRDERPPSWWVEGNGGAGWVEGREMAAGCAAASAGRVGGTRRRPHGVQEKSAAMLTHAAPRLFANDGLQVVSTARRRRRPGASPR